MPKTLSADITASQAVDAASEMLIQLIRGLMPRPEDREAWVLDLITSVAKEPSEASARMAIISRVLERLEEE